MEGANRGDSTCGSVAPRGAKPGLLGREGAFPGHLVPPLSENALHEPCLCHYSGIRHFPAPWDGQALCCRQFQGESPGL